MRLLAFAFLVVIGIGCTPPAPSRNLVPIDGVIRVDGKPTSGISLVLHPVDGGGDVSTGISTEDGVFHVDTFTAGDGAAPGTYVVTFVWSEFDPISRGMKGDKLGGRYADVATSKIRWAIPPGDRYVAGNIDLETNTRSKQSRSD